METKRTHTTRIDANNVENPSVWISYNGMVEITLDDRANDVRNVVEIKLTQSTGQQLADIINSKITEHQEKQKEKANADSL